jgi:CBS domain-containing protein
LSRRVKMKVKDVMTEPVITIGEETPLQQVAQIMLEHRIGGVPVINESGELTGIVTESDFTAKEKCVPFSLFRAPQLFGSWLGKDAEGLYAAARKIPARQIMSTSVVTVTENDSIEKILDLILSYDINRIPVVRDQKPVGIVARRDLLRIMKVNQTKATQAAGST